MILAMQPRSELAVKLRLSCRLFLCTCIFGFLLMGTEHAWAGPSATTTILTMASAGKVVASGGSVGSGSKVTLTAAVASGSTKVTVGQVNFCDASASSCTDIHLLGTAQLTSAGTATLNLRPSIGNHSYNAVFAGTPHGATAYAASTSSSAGITLSGTVWPTVTSLAQTGNAGNYTLTATVGGNASAAPTGSVSFLDSSSGNAALGGATLGSGTAGLTFLSAPPATAGASGLAPFSGPSVIGDFNGDGILDGAGTSNVLVCTSNGCGNGYLTVLLGDGTGSFTSSQVVDLGGDAGAGEVVTGDFNGDGIPDLAVVMSSNTHNEVEILLGNGDGTFTAKGSVAAGGVFAALAVGDFNGDGIPDLALGNFAGEFIAILLGNGDGTFTPQTAATSGTSGNPGAIAVGDFNGDGIPDLAVAPASGSGKLTILLGNGDGTFTAAPSPMPGNEPESISLGDFNRDGHLDIAVLNCPLSCTLTILLGKENGTFSPTTGSPFTVSGSISGDNSPPIATGDFNGDGIPDLIVSGSPTTVLLGNGDGTFSVVPLNGVSSFPVVGDFNGDGRTDTYGSVTVSQTASATANGIAVAPSTGANQVVASYGGDNINGASTSGPTTLNATQGPPVVSLTAAPNPAPLGTSVTLTATVTGSGQAPTGEVTFYDGSNLLGTATLNSSGVATYATSSFIVGSNALLVSYGGDINYNNANSAAVNLTVTPALLAPTVTVTPSAASITPAQSLTVSVAVNGTTGGATPTGTVTLASDSYTSQQMLTGGSASFTIAAGALNSGADTLTASFSGNGAYATAMGTATVTVSPVGMAIPAPAPVSSGASVTATATISASDSYSGTLTLKCTLTSSPTGAQSPPTCALNPTEINVAAGGNGTAAVTVNTTAASTSALAHPLRQIPFVLGGGGAVFAIVLFFGVPSRTRRWMSMAFLLAAVVASCSLGCGGGSGGQTSGTGTSATTVGNYVFTVTATDSANANITASTTVSIAVQ
jgi:hypothetical protein